MAYTWDEIFAAMQQRREKNSPILEQMITIRNRYNGDWVVPYLTQEEAPELPPLTPSIIANTIDNYGMRAGSVLPAIRCPAVDPSKQTGTRSREYANIRRRAITATYNKSRMNLALRRAYRHLAGYATCCMVVVPDLTRREMPRIEVRDPLNCYPDPRTGDNFDDPENVGFIFSKSSDWVMARYPETREMIGRQVRGEQLWDMVEWIDQDDCVIGLMGPQDSAIYRNVTEPMRWSMELRRWPNRVGMVPAVTPGRVTLDRIASQLTHITGITDLMARMMALDIMAKEKSIFPDRYVLGKEGMTPQILGGEWKDGRSGEMNVVLDAQAIGSLPFSPDPTASQAIDRLERNARVSSGLVPQMGGETYGALRTGRGIDALMGAAVDPVIQEMQEIMAAALPTLNEAIFETYKAYWPNKLYVMDSGWAKDPGEVSFTPSKHFETSSNSVSYAIAGADAQQTNIILGQMLGAGTISRTTFRESHPWIGDAQSEAARVDEELMENTMMQAIQQQVVAGALPLMMLAEIERARREQPAGDIFTAVEVANRRVQEQQAQAPPEPGPDQVAAPEAQPGLAAPPPSGEMQQPGAIGATEGQAGLRELMNALSQTSRRA